MSKKRQSAVEEPKTVPITSEGPLTIPGVAVEPPTNGGKDLLEGKSFSIRDAEEVIALLTFGCKLLKAEKQKLENGQSPIFFTFGPESHEIWRQYVYSQKMPVDDIRMVFQATRVFKKIIRDNQ